MGLRMESMETWNHLTRFIKQQEQLGYNKNKNIFTLEKLHIPFFYFKGTCMCEGKTILKREKWERNREKLVIFVA